MKRIGIIIPVLAFGVALTGCGKKQQLSEQTIQDPMSMEALSALTTEQKAAPEVKIKDVKTLAAQAAVPVTSEPKLDPLPPSGPYKPSVTEIQTALKNVGFYNGKIDGQTGPNTKKAVEEFQQANGLKADGKVGPKTWLVLSKHLSAAPAAETVMSDTKNTAMVQTKKR